MVREGQKHAWGRAQAAGWWLAAALIPLATYCAFTWLDHRPPFDHDDYYLRPLLPHLRAVRSGAPLSTELIEWWTVGGPHPPLPGAGVLVADHLLGPTRSLLRWVNAPFVALAGAGCFGLARLLGACRHPALVAALAAVLLPGFATESHAFNLQVHAAALTPGAWALVLGGASTRGRTGAALALAGAVAQVARAHCHGVVWTDVAVLAAVGLLIALLGSERRLRAAARHLGATALVGVGCAHLLGWTRERQALYSVPRYLELRQSEMSVSSLFEPHFDWMDWAARSLEATVSGQLGLLGTAALLAAFLAALAGWHSLPG
jgi:hypothetical protein